jgi:hypothetical protein
MAYVNSYICALCVFKSFWQLLCAGAKATALHALVEKKKMEYIQTFLIQYRIIFFFTCFAI